MAKKRLIHIINTAAVAARNSTFGEYEELHGSGNLQERRDLMIFRFCKSASLHVLTMPYGALQLCSSNTNDTIMTRKREVNLVFLCIRSSSFE